MKQNYDKLISGIYFILMFAPIPYIASSAFSYYWVQRTFGQIPNNEMLYKLLKEYKGTVQILPFKYGDNLLLTFCISLLIFPLFILLNYLLSKKTAQIHFNKTKAILLTAIYAIAFILAFRTDPFGGWYLQLMAD